MNWNLYYSTKGYAERQSVDWAHDSAFASFADFQSASGEDANSLGGVNPQVENVSSVPTDLDIASSSPAVNAGSTALTCSIGWCDPNGPSPHSIYGASDYLGAARLKGSTIDIGAYEVTGITGTTVSVALTSMSDVVRGSSSTTLSATVTATPASAGVPSGTVQFMNGSQVLGTQTLLPLNVSESSAIQPLSGTQLRPGNNDVYAVYSGKSIAIGCCTKSSPPGGGAQVAVYPSARSATLMVRGMPLSQHGVNHFWTR